VRALVFDLDGTLIDTVYAHVFAWQMTLQEAGLPVEAWKIHRRIGMSGGLFTMALAREIGRPIDDEEAARLQDRHGRLFLEMHPVRSPLPGAPELLADLRRRSIPWAIATSGRHPEIDASLAALGVSDEDIVVDRGDVLRAKPEPDVFLLAAERLGVATDLCYVVGDAVWDLLAARRARMLSLGLLSGGYGEQELLAAGAFRVFRDVTELATMLDELGLIPR
jgi:HAD superfamily hydrolase (TIGR01549 family)